jgi:hypothetical protein
MENLLDFVLENAFWIAMIFAFLLSLFLAFSEEKKQESSNDPPEPPQS